MIERVEFRIPISPTQSFYDQVRLFEFGLRRSGPEASNATLRVCVGGDVDLEEIIAANLWSKGRNVVWERVPDSTYSRHWIYGTANWRLAQGPGYADIIVLCDADSVFLRSVALVFRDLPKDRPAMMGVMAHYPPPETPGLPHPKTEQFWPELLKSHNIDPPTEWYQYSMGADPEGKPLPASPPYFNLGFIVLNRQAAEIIAPYVEPMEDTLLSTGASPMRCQISLTLNCLRLGVDMIPISAAYNCANDHRFMDQHSLTVADVKVLHYLRTDEVERGRILDLQHINRTNDAGMLAINRQLLRLANECAASGESL